jgi:hypothetical protein
MEPCKDIDNVDPKRIYTKISRNNNPQNARSISKIGITGSSISMAHESAHLNKETRAMENGILEMQ